MKRLDFNSFVELKEYVHKHYDEYEVNDIVVVHNTRFLKTDEPHDIKLRIARIGGKVGDKYDK